MRVRTLLGILLVWTHLACMELGHTSHPEPVQTMELVHTTPGAGTNYGANAYGTPGAGAYGASGPGAYGIHGAGANMFQTTHQPYVPNTVSVKPLCRCVFTV